MENGQTLCNYCKNEVRYINTRKEGTVKCEPFPIKGIQESGRVVEVYLIHDCHNGTLNQVSEEENGQKRLWVGPYPPQKGRNNGNNGEK